MSSAFPILGCALAATILFSPHRSFEQRRVRLQFCAVLHSSSAPPPTRTAAFGARKAHILSLVLPLLFLAWPSLESAGQGLNLAAGLISSPHTCRAGFYLQHPREEAAPMVRLTWGSVLAVGFWCLLKLEIPLTENLALIDSC